MSSSPVPGGLSLLALLGMQDPGSSLWGRTEQMWGQPASCAVGCP